MAERVTGLLLLPGEAALAAYLVRAGVATIEQRNGSAPADAVHLRDQLAAFARETRETSTAQARARRESSERLILADPAGSPDMQAMTVTEAAGLLGVSEQTIRSRCRRGDLPAARSPAGRWLIDSDLGVTP